MKDKNIKVRQHHQEREGKVKGKKEQEGVVRSVVQTELGMQRLKDIMRSKLSESKCKLVREVL